MLCTASGSTAQALTVLGAVERVRSDSTGPCPQHRGKCSGNVEKENVPSMEGASQCLNSPEQELQPWTVGALRALVRTTVEVADTDRGTFTFKAITSISYSGSYATRGVKTRGHGAVLTGGPPAQSGCL